MIDRSVYGRLYAYSCMEYKLVDKYTGAPLAFSQSGRRCCKLIPSGQCGRICLSGQPLAGQKRRRDEIRFA
ncbi:unnamed protein product [Protopolystoma xenopodis]|uniref:Uncharacterized protein n=1 Tax=Protopolystoma xenopodis TaxID=117903 RepID=A0A448WXR7_9PLAT|nr:unnamed protein product [Protopolystoma xenopodis]